MNDSALPTFLQSASRRADISGLPGLLLLRPVKLLASCADLTSFLATEAFVGSEEAHLRASLRPPPKLHVRVARMQLSQDSATLGCKRRN